MCLQMKYVCSQRRKGKKPKKAFFKDATGYNWKM